MSLLTVIVILFLNLAPSRLVGQPLTEVQTAAVSNQTNGITYGGSPNNGGEKDNSLRNQSAGFFMGLTAGLILGLIAHKLTVKRAIDDRRREFRSLLRKHIQDFESIEWKKLSDGKLFESYAKTINPVADACAKIYEDIRNTNKLRFRQARVAYCGLQQHDIEAREFREGKFPPLACFPDFQTGIRKLIELLEALAESSK